MMVNWSQFIDGHGPNSIPLTVPYNPREQAFAHGYYHVMDGEDGEGNTEELDPGLPVISSMSYPVAPAPQPAATHPIPRNRMCDGCERAVGCLHVDDGFDTDTDDEELFEKDPEFDDQMVQAWATAKTDPKLYNNIAGDLCCTYLLARSRWRKFTGRSPRRRMIERRRNFAQNPQLRDQRK